MIALKTEIFVKAHIRRLELHGIPAYVIHHGDDDAGDLLVKLSTLDGQASLFRREYDMETGERHWSCICLLYTSPSPRDRQKSRMPSSA